METLTVAHITSLAKYKPKLAIVRGSFEAAIANYHIAYRLTHSTDDYDSIIVLDIQDNLLLLLKVLKGPTDEVLKEPFTWVPES